VIQTIDRVIGTLFALRSSGPMTLAELAEGLGLPASTILSNLRQLHRGRLIDHDPETGEYRLAAGLVSLGRGYLDSSQLTLRSSRWLQELSRQIGAAVRLGVPFDEEYIVVQHELRPDGTLQLSELGMSAPLQGSAFGKLFLSYRAPDVSAILSPPGSFEAERIRRSGIAEERNEASTGNAALVAAIFDRTGQIAAGIGIELAGGDWPAPKATVTALIQAAQHISTELGARAWPPVLLDPETSGSREMPPA
jgi:DNA-binding IclR family transcriptional regulator